MMKKILLTLLGSFLAFGFIFAPAIHADAKGTAKGDQQHVKAAKKNGRSNAAQSNSRKAKVKEAQKDLIPINKNINKVEKNYNLITNEINVFYSNPSSEDELSFFDMNVNKLKADSRQLDSLKKQIDHIVKKNGETTDVTDAYNKVQTLKTEINDELIKLQTLHSTFGAPETPAPSDGQDD
ncbi:hypothetical protein QS257_05945 [Terrilactibacillus sp. S3-3]|nr:hypothetical protein QS257_05945 [Terrilactibacillus sp. S3-3]